MEALQKENEEYRQKLEMYENCIDAELERRLNDKLAMYNSSHTSIIQRLDQLEKEKGAVTEIKRKFGGLEKSLAEKIALIDRMELEKAEREELVKLLLDEKDQLMKRVESEEASDKLKQENKDLKAMKLKEERKKSTMTATEQITRLETAKTTAEKQMEAYKKKVDNQKKEIQRMEKDVQKLTTEKNRKQQAIEAEAEKHAKADKGKEEKINSLSKINAQLEESLKDVNERFELMKKQLDEAVEDREHLRIQVANSVADRSQAMMAMELTSGFNKLVDQVFGANKAGGDGKSLLETLQCQVSEMEDNISHMKECQICFNPFDNDTRVPAKGKCPHAIYCMACLRKLVKTKKNACCPTCRLPLKGDDIVPVKLNFV